MRVCGMASKHTVPGKDCVVVQVERSCRRFDKRGKGRLDAAEFYNAVKLQNKLECTKDDMHKLLEDLDLDKDNRASIKVRHQLLMRSNCAILHYYSGLLGDASNLSRCVRCDGQE